MPKANSSSSFISPHPPIPLPDHHNHPITRRSSSTLNEASSLPPPANAVSSNIHTEHENDDNQNKQIISLPFNWQVNISLFFNHNLLFYYCLFLRLQNFL
jgi:hypothetical protein